MADLAYTDLTWTMIIKDMWRKQRVNTWSLAYGGAGATYPANGIPLGATVAGALKRLGMGRFADVELLNATKDGYVYMFDQTLFTIRKFQTAQHTPTGTAAGQVFTGTPTVPTFGGAGYVESLSWQNIKGADADVAGSMTTDQAAGPTNDDIIDTYAAIAAGAWTYTENGEIDVPRNVAVCLYNDSGGARNMEEGAFTATITGTFRGAAQTSVVTETFTAGNKAIANTKYRWKYGAKPFDHITTVVVTGLTVNQNGIKIGIGIGRLLGMPMNTVAEVVADFVKVLKAGADLVPTAYSTTNKTLDLGAIADNDDFDIQFVAASMSSYTPAGTNAASALTIALVAAGVLTEVPNGHTAAATVVRLRAVGI